MPNHYTTIAICSPGYEFDVDAFNTQHAKTDFCELVMPRPECLNGIVAGKAFALGGDLDPVAIKFQSAWCAPKILDKIAAWLMDQHQFDRVSFVGFDPGDASTSLLPEIAGTSRTTSGTTAWIAEWKHLTNQTQQGRF